MAFVRAQNQTDGRIFIGQRPVFFGVVAIHVHLANIGMGQAGVEVAAEFEQEVFQAVYQSFFKFAFRILVLEIQKLQHVGGL